MCKPVSAAPASQIRRRPPDLSAEDHPALGVGQNRLRHLLSMYVVFKIFVFIQITLCPKFQTIYISLLCIHCLLNFGKKYLFIAFQTSTFYPATLGIRTSVSLQGRRHFFFAESANYGGKYPSTSHIFGYLYQFLFLWGVHIHLLTL